MKRIACIALITGLVMILMYALGANASKRTANPNTFAVSTFDGGNPLPLPDCRPTGCMDGQAEK